LDNFQVLGSCVPDAVGPVAMVTELGDPLDTVRLLQLSWEDRLRVWTALVVGWKAYNMKQKKNCCWWARQDIRYVFLFTQEIWTQFFKY